ncbi:MAG: hypothetical protein ACREIA_19960, partial [Opitutaceae bacterium]
SRAGVHFPAPVGLGRRLDPNALALDGLARFGVGFLEAGPVGPDGAASPQIQLCRESDGTLSETARGESGGASWWRSRLARRDTRPVPLLARLRATVVSDFSILAAALADQADVFVIEALETRIDLHRQAENPRDTTALAWFWGTALGAAMSAGGLLALGIALTHVLLPYDEHYLGLTREMLRTINPRLLDFMTHDRVTLAGTMLGLGSLYIALARKGVRRGAHWAQVTVGASAVTGFLSFFSFLGFGYFDPFHAFVSAALLPLSLLALALLRGGAERELLAPEWRTDAAWRRAQWGQLLLIVHAVGLLGAGVTITTIGMTDVFVAEDLAYLCMPAEDLASINEHLIPVVAHDRASLGGMLLANGAGLLLATLWGFRRGRAWLWRAFLWTGVPAYVAAIGIHLYVG